MKPEGVFVGHSHSYAILSAYDIAGYPETGPIRLHRFFLMDREFEPNLCEDLRTLNSRLKAELERLCSERPISAGFLSIDGNAHTLFALVKHPRPFDFVLAEEPNWPLDPGAEVVPEAFVVEALLERLGRSARLFEALRATVPAPLFQIESAPPVRSNEVVMSTKEGVFWETLRMGELGVSPPFLRLKLWRLHSRLVETICRAAGVGFIRAPREAMDDDGFLLETGVQPGDATHANSWYGGHVLKQMEGPLGLS